MLRNWKVWLVVLLVLVSFLSVEPKRMDGALVKSVTYPASEYIKQGSIITMVNGIPINSKEDFYNLNLNGTVYIVYKVKKFPYVYVEQDSVALKSDYLDLITVDDVPTTNINYGLDIVGGARVLLKIEENATDDQVYNLIDVLSQRLNVYGMKDIPVTYVKDFEGNKYIRIEFAGATKEEVESLIAKEGKFEAKIGNVTVFAGTDVKSVCMSSSYCVNRITPIRSGNDVLWQFMFQIDLTKEAAERFANVTANLSQGECTSSGCYLNETIDFYLDDQPIEDGQLRIASSLKGKVVQSPTIVGSRHTKIEAEKEMKRLQAILQSGRLPLKVSIVRIDTISPKLGEWFVRNTFSVLVIALAMIAVVVSVRYRNWKIIALMVATALIEAFSTLGIASMLSSSTVLQWTIDLPAIAGLIAGVGTGIDDQIVITDELLRGQRAEERTTKKERIRRAFFIVFAAFFTSAAAMIPLAMAGVGVFRGFAITTIIAITIGVLITRPAYAELVEKIIKE